MGLFNKNSIKEKPPVVETEDFSVLSYDELSQKSKEAHQADLHHYNQGQNALCKIVIGAILLIIGLLFLVLSFRRVKNKAGALDVLSLQFFIFIICTGVAVVLLTIGLIKLIQSQAKRRKIKQVIVELAQWKTKRMIK